MVCGCLAILTPSIPHYFKFNRLESSRTHVVKKIIECRVDKDIQDAELNAAIHIVAAFVQLDIVRALTECGADFNTLKILNS
jgi:hypothetical protein